MEVVITPDLFPMTNNIEDAYEIRSLIEELKEEKVIPRNMSKGEFMLDCMVRCLNEYRKDIVVYD